MNYPRFIEVRKNYRRSWFIRLGRAISGRAYGWAMGSMENDVDRWARWLTPWVWLLLAVSVGYMLWVVWGAI
jgi:hypothetical protein